MSPVHPAPPAPAAQALFAILADVPDPRNASGRRHPLASLLGLLVVSFCTGRRTVKDAVRMGRELRMLRKALGFTHPKCPSQSTYTRLFKVLAVSTLRDVVSRWLASLVEMRQRAGRDVVAAVDGKTMRGTGTHVLNIFVHDFWLLLDQYEVGEKSNEMSAFRAMLPEFLARYPFLTILTFDAMFCERETMAILTEGNRMGIFQVKENQPEALRRLERWFAPLPRACPSYSSGPEKKRGLHRDARRVGLQRPA